MSMGLLLCSKRPFVPVLPWLAGNRWIPWVLAAVARPACIAGHVSQKSKPYPDPIKLVDGMEGVISGAGHRWLAVC
jgi:hypothetical protein